MYETVKEKVSEAVSRAKDNASEKIDETKTKVSQTMESKPKQSEMSGERVGPEVDRTHPVEVQKDVGNDWSPSKKESDGQIMKN